MIKRVIILIIVLFAFFSCNQSKKQENNSQKESISETKILKDTVSLLLEESLKTDTLEIDNREPFLYFKSGYSLNKKIKNAIYISCPTDSTYIIKLYVLDSLKWSLIDSLDKLESHPIQFDIIYDDYNFDGQKDIYLQLSASNGWSLSYGHLLTIEAKSNKLVLHKEASEFANMKPNPKTESVESEISHGRNMKGEYELSILTNKWINWKLVTKSKKDITIK